MITRTLLAIATLVSISSQSFATGIPDRTAPGGMGIQLKANDIGGRYFSLDQAFSLVQDTGFKFVRAGLYWKDAETTKGTYKFSTIDAVVAQAAQRGMWVSITLMGGNSLYENDGIGGIQTLAGREGFANFAAAAAARYQGKNVVFEIWNEPNITSFWRSPSNSNEIADEYAALVKVVAPAIHAADPNAYVVAGSISALWSASFAWFDRCVQQGMLSSGINGVSVHPYGFSWPELAVTKGYAVLRGKMNAAGKSGLSIVTSEVGYGYSSLLTDSTSTSTKYSSEEVPYVQGWMLTRQMLNDLMAGVGYSIWYEFRRQESQTHTFGIFEIDLTPKPSVAAMRTLAQQLTGYRYKSRLATSSSLDYVALFENALGKQKLVVWTAADEASTNKRSIPHDIVIPVSGSGTVRAVNTFGDVSDLSASSGQVRVYAEGGPKYLDLSQLSTATPTPSPTPAPTTTRNLALKKTVSVSSGAAAASNLVDGNKTSSSSRWMSSSGYPQFAEVDLGGTYTISEIRYLQSSQRTADFKIEIYDGTTWKTVSTATGNQDLAIVRKISPVVGRKVRFTVTRGSYYQKVFEMEVVGQ